MNIMRVVIVTSLLTAVTSARGLISIEETEQEIIQMDDIETNVGSVETADMSDTYVIKWAAESSGDQGTLSGDVDASSLSVGQTVGQALAAFIVPAMFSIFSLFFFVTMYVYSPRRKVTHTRHRIFAPQAVYCVKDDSAYY